MGKIRIMSFNNVAHLNQVIEISKKQFNKDGWPIKYFESEIKNPSHFSFICVDGNDEVVAFIFFMQSEGECGLDYNITNLACGEKFKRLGYATKLIKFCFQHAKKNNINKIWLEVCESNLPALHLYQKLGFKVDYVRKDYYKNQKDALIMSKELE